MNSSGSLLHWTMSIFSPLSSCTTACTRIPRGPTHAPTGSTFRVPRVYRNFGTTASFACHGLQFYDAIVNFGDFQFEEALQKPRVCTRNDYLWSSGSLADFRNIHFHAGPMSVMLSGDLFAGRQDCFYPAEIDQYIAVFRTLYDTGNNITFAVLEFLVDHGPLGLTDALDNHLLSGLSGDAPEITRVTSISTTSSS